MQEPKYGEAKINFQIKADGFTFPEAVVASLVVATTGLKYGDKNCRNANEYKSDSDMSAVGNYVKIYKELISSEAVYKPRNM